MEYKDERLKLMNEILNGMKVLKLYAWEPSMEKLVADIREKEMHQHKQQVYASIVQEAGYYCTPFFASIAAFAAYTMLGSGDHTLTPSKAFVSLTLFNMMRSPLAFMPHAVLCAVRANVSLQRIAEFLVSEELDPNTIELSRNENGTIPYSEVFKMVQKCLTNCSKPNCSKPIPEFRYAVVTKCRCGHLLEID
jgi:ATP-binding cassette subfamily C (CFTR/MRP) protein 1